MDSKELTAQENAGITPLVNLRFINYLTEQLRLHGLSFVLMAMAIWYFQNQNHEITRDLKACNETIISEYKNDRIQMLEVISNNTAALHQLRMYPTKD